jgi:hypothetical protein
MQLLLFLAVLAVLLTSVAAEQQGTTSWKVERHFLCDTVKIEGDVRYDATLLAVLQISLRYLYLFTLLTIS